MLDSSKLNAPLLDESTLRTASLARRTDAGPLAFIPVACTVLVGVICILGIVQLFPLSPVGVASLVLAATGDSFWFDFFAGGFVGALAKTFSAPIERVKLLIQTQDKIPSIVSGELPRYKGICDCFTRVAREQGILSFWRGNLPNVLRYFPVAAFNFAFNDCPLTWLNLREPQELKCSRIVVAPRSQ